MRRPSASVLRISIVWPDRLFTTSPGLIAVPLGRFSHAGTMHTRLSFGFNPAIARSVPITLAAPPMSNFISSISADGLIEMPPLSKVMPLPTSTTGAASFAAPRYCATMNLGASLEPCATARNAPMPSLSTSLRSSTSTFSACSLPSARTVCAR